LLIFPANPSLAVPIWLRHSFVKGRRAMPNPTGILHNPVIYIKYLPLSACKKESKKAAGVSTGRSWS
jgi:hypothetical protein